MNLNKLFFNNNIQVFPNSSISFIFLNEIGVPSSNSSLEFFSMFLIGIQEFLGFFRMIYQIFDLHSYLFLLLSRISWKVCFVQDFEMIVFATSVQFFFVHLFVDHFFYSSFIFYCSEFLKVIWSKLKRNFDITFSFCF